MAETIMAAKEDVIEIELTKASVVRGHGMKLLGLGDNNGDLIGIRAFKDGQPFNFTGYTCVGYFMRANGTTVVLSGTVSNNWAGVWLAQACYAYEGQFALAIKVVHSGNGVEETIRIVDGIVTKTTTDTIVDPGTVVPDLAQLLAKIAACDAATAAANAAATNATNATAYIAPTYSSSSSYAVGDYAIYSGNLYRCTTAIPSGESWTSGHWTQVKTMGEVGELKSAVDAEKEESTQKSIGNIATTATPIGNDDDDLYIADDDGNVLIKATHGEIVTKNFNSVKMSMENQYETPGDFCIADDEGNVLAEFANGHIKTKNFNSARVGYVMPSFSILGDSYSTFDGYTNPSTNEQYYPAEGVNSVEQTWWHIFAAAMKCYLVQNNSYSGSPICYDGYGTGTADAKEYSFVKRSENLANASLIIIEGGTNDSWAHVGMGNYKYSDWTEEDLTTFRPALACLLDFALKHYIGARIMFMLNNQLSADINESVETICEHYDIPILKLSNIDKQNGHPTPTGMAQIATQLQAFIETL